MFQCHQDGRPRSDKEKEDLDHAIALSLAEDLKRPKGMLLIYKIHGKVILLSHLSIFR